MKKQVTLKSETGQLFRGGIFDRNTKELVDKMNSSLAFDYQLASQVVRVSEAHVRVLKRQSAIYDVPIDAKYGGLGGKLADIDAGRLDLPDSLKEVRMNLQSHLRDPAASIGSKNSNIELRSYRAETDLKVWLKGVIQSQREALLRLITLLLDLANLYSTTSLSGFTQLTYKQLDRFGFRYMGYIDLMFRDIGKLNEVVKCINEQSKGVFAWAETRSHVDTDIQKSELVFRPSFNHSDYSFYDTDIAIDYTVVASTLSLHLSQFTKEIMLLSSPIYEFISPPSVFTREALNKSPKDKSDSLEWVNLLSEQVIVNLNRLLADLKGMPETAYKNMADEQNTVFDAADALSRCMNVVQGVVAAVFVDTSRFELAYLPTKDLVDWFVREHHENVQDAYHIIGRLINCAAAQKCTLSELDDSTVQGIDGRLNQKFIRSLTSETQANRQFNRSDFACEYVQKSIIAARKRLLEIRQVG